MEYTRSFSLLEVSPKPPLPSFPPAASIKMENDIKSSLKLLVSWQLKLIEGNQKLKKQQQLSLKPA